MISCSLVPSCCLWGLWGCRWPFSLPTSLRSISVLVAIMARGTTTSLLIIFVQRGQEVFQVSDPSNVLRNLYVVTFNPLGDREVVGQGDRPTSHLECSVSNYPFTSQLTGLYLIVRDQGGGCWGRTRKNLVLPSYIYFQIFSVLILRPCLWTKKLRTASLFLITNSGTNRGFNAQIPKK